MFITIINQPPSAPSPLLGIYTYVGRYKLPPYTNFAAVLGLHAYRRHCKKHCTFNKALKLSCVMYLNAAKWTPTYNKLIFKSYFLTITK